MTNPTTALRKLRWPPSGLGLGTPANLALLSPTRRATFLRTALLAAVVGVLTVAVMAAIDQFLFNGVSAERVRLVGKLPIAQRLLIVAFSAIAEEFVYRLLIATGIAALFFVVLRRRFPQAAIVSMWLGLLTAALLFGLAHVGNLPNVPHPYLRAIVLNGFAAIVLGALYWFRGLESAVIAHLTADVTLYLVIASFL